MITILSGRPQFAENALLRETGRALKSGGEAVYIVVPKQLTLQTELTLIRALEPGGSFRLNVLSPERLCVRIFETAGRPALEKVDDRGRVMLARRALNDCEDSLRVYAGAGHRRGFPARAARQLELFRQAGLSPEDLTDLADHSEGLFSAKLRDMSGLLDSYLRSLSGQFLDGEAEFEEAAARAAKSAVVRNSGMIFYGFDVMPRPLHALIARLGLSCDVTLLFASDPDDRAPDADVFLPVNRSVGRLRGEAAALGAEVRSARFDETDVQEKPAAVEHLSRYLFAGRPAVFDGDPAGITLMAMKNPQAEALYVAAKCRELAMAGARWNDIVVASPDIAAHSRCLEDAFAAFDIPIFLSSSRPASRHALAEALLSALKLIWKGFRTEDALALLRTGYTGVEQPDPLANYLTRYAPRGRALTSPFVKGGDEAVEAETARDALIAPVLRLREGLREAKTLKRQLAAVFGYLTDLNAYEKSLDRQQELSAVGLNRLSGEESQVWNRIVSTLDQMAALMGEKRLSLEDLTETLRESLDSAVIKPLPQSGDAVYARSLDQAMSGQAEHLFLIGMSDQTYAGTDCLFTDRQMAEIGRAADRWICADATEKALMRRYYLKSALSAAGRDVTFTYPVSSEDGAAQRGAALISDMKRMFPLLREGGGLEDEPYLNALFLSAPGAAMLRSGAHLDTDAGRKALTTLAQQRSPQVERLLRCFDSRHLSEQLRPETAKRLYGALNSASVTRLEQFSKCPFAHFMKYALSPENQEPFALTARDEGGFYHDAVRSFLADSRGELNGMTPEEAQRRMDRVSDLLLDRMEKGMLFDSAVSLAEKRRLKATARSAAEALVNQLAGSSFLPVELELEFGREDGAALRLKTEGGPCSLEGRIDRVDEWEAPDEDFLRVIDYKRGNNELRLFEAYYGLQLQLIVYLAAAMRRRDDTGAGVYYFKIDEGIIPDQSTDAFAIEEQRRKAMRLNGITLAERPVIDAMASDSGVINVRIGKDGLIYRTSPVVERDGIRLLIQRTLENAADSVNRIRSGEAAASPARTKKQNPCIYCDHRRACLFDDTLNAAQVRRVEDMSNAEVLEKLRLEASAKEEVRT